MGLAPTHRFGQIIGEVLERAVRPILIKFAREHGLYLDMKGQRGCRKGRKCTWTDLKGNNHDLDYVLERGGSDDVRGTPVAFIETAWRRYTKHSRNKAQEIQGAIVPLSQKYRNSSPFLGAILAGVFTQGALNQLRSLGFNVLFFPYDVIVDAFKKSGIDARFDESTTDEESARKVAAYEQLSESSRDSLAKRMLKARQGDLDQFVAALTRAISRQIASIVVLPLHGTACECTAVSQAVDFLSAYSESTGGGPVHRYEILIRYSNGDRVEATFQDKESAIAHLRAYQA